MCIGISRHSFRGPLESSFDATGGPTWTRRVRGRRRGTRRKCSGSWFWNSSPRERESRLCDDRWDLWWCFSRDSWRQFRSLLGAVLGPFWGLLGGLLGPLGGVLGASWGLSGPFRAVSGRKARDVSSGSLSWAPLGAVLGLSWAVLGASWAVLAPSWADLGACWGPLGPSWGGLGVLLDRVQRREGREAVYDQNVRFP